MGERANRLIALIQKETLQLLRDRRTLAIMLLLPLIELLLFAYAIRLVVDHLPTVVADMSMDAESRRFLAALQQSGYFDIKEYVASQADVVQALDEGSAAVGVVIGPGFAAHIDRGDAQALMVLDGSDSLSVRSGYSAAVAVAQARAMQIVQTNFQHRGVALQVSPITTSTIVLYNPGMNDLVFIMPGLLGMLLQVITVMTTAQAVVREHEMGTIEQLLATPARPLELMVGKLAPYTVVMLVNLAIITLVGVFWFDVPFKGNGWLFLWLSLLFIWCGLGLGLLVSTVSHTQAEAQEVAVMLTMFSMLLTGFIFPRGPMPAAIAAIGDLIPLTYFIRIARAIISKGIGVTFMWTDILALIVYSVLIVFIAAATAKKRLD